MSLPLDRLKRKYEGPGWPEWVFGLACAVLLADNLSDFLNAGKAQTAAAYYFQTSPVTAIHSIGIILNCLILLATVTWIVRPITKKFAQPALFTLSTLGFALVWYELTFALTLKDPRFSLNALPFEPINNAGIIGATIFITYSVLKLPQGKLKTIPATLIKFAFAISLLLTQLMLYQKITLPNIS